jgi:hypothetical protein
LPASYTSKTQSAEKAARQLADQAFPPRDVKGRFPPGASGNPSGLSRFCREARKTFCDASPQMARELIALATTAADERIRCVATIAALGYSGLGEIALLTQSIPGRNMMSERQPAGEVL